MTTTTDAPRRLAPRSRMHRLKRSLVLATAAVVGTIPAAVVVAGYDAPAAQAATSESGFSPSQWAAPDITYRPGVRWWWPGGAVEDSVLDQQLDYLAKNGFGTVEINPFGATPLPGDEARVKDIYTPAFYAHLERAVSRARDLGITVDLNMGSGWNANSPNVTVADGTGNMGLGRSTSTGAQLKSGTVAIPAVAKSRQYADPVPTFNPALVKLQGVLVAKRTGTAGAITGDAAKFDDGTTTWDQRVTVDPANSFMIDASKLGSSSGTVTLPADVAAKVADGSDYEVIALYVLPAGSSGVDTARPDWYVVDHMDASKTLDYLNDWLGEANLNRIITKYDNVRAVFNDSLELSTDSYYNAGLYDLAKDAERNGLGYDFSKYLPTVYRQNLKNPAYFPTNTMGGSADSYVTTTTDPSIKNRILADFRTLVGVKFAEGLKGFQRGAHANGLLYRQQAYNPPMDQIGAAKYIDIPEQEQGNENNLRTAASGGHLYGRNLVTAEQFTLGTNPTTNSLDTLKTGFDLMATSGVNNFQYHGLNYPYGKGTAMYGENGWAAFPTIGVDSSENNTLAKYLPELNAYAARLNYLGQQGRPSMDVAVYAPFNTKAVSTGAVPTLNSNGYAWDVINDASLNDATTTYKNGKLSVNGGAMTYDALVVQSTAVPVETMRHLLDLAEQGAPIIFYGATPSTQSGYADGNYAARDAEVAKLADQILLEGDATTHPSTTASLLTSLRRFVDPEVTYDTNDGVRFVRRDLADGSTLTFLRNTSTRTNTITLRADAAYNSYYWLDQRTGKIYDADVTQTTDGDTTTFTLDPGKDAYGGSPSNGIALLAAPNGVTLPTAALTAGLPDGLNRVAPETSQVLSADSLTVTADNLDGAIGGALETKSFTQDVLGNWKDAAFQNGQLRNVVSDGIYATTVDVNPTAGRRYSLDLGSVFTAATVKVNGVEAGRALYAPYKVDLTKQLRAGRNTIEIAVTPRKANRYYPAATNRDGQYSTATLVDAGLVGPLTFETSPASAAPPTSGSTEAPIPGATPTPAGPAAPGLIISSVTAKLHTGKVTTRQRAKVKVKVATPGRTPTGTLSVAKRNGKRIASAAVSDGRTLTLRLPKQAAGRHKITISFSGIGGVLGSSTTLTLKVVRP